MLPPGAVPEPANLKVSCCPTACVKIGPISAVIRQSRMRRHPAHCSSSRCWKEERAAWRHLDLPQGGPSVHRQAHRAGYELRGASRHRDREHPAAQRVTRVAFSSKPRHPTCCRSSRSSPGELELVFQAMLENATRICDAKFGNLLLYEGNAFRVAAMHGAPPAWAELRLRRSNSPFWSGNPSCSHCRDPSGCSTSPTSELNRPTSIASPRAGSARRGRPARAPVLHGADGQGGRADRRGRHLSAGRASLSPTSRSGWSRISPRRPSSPLRIPACSTSSASRCSSRLPPPTCSR